MSEFEIQFWAWFRKLRRFHRIIALLMRIFTPFRVTVWRGNMIVGIGIPNLDHIRKVDQSRVDKIDLSAWGKSGQ